LPRVCSTTSVISSQLDLHWMNMYKENYKIFMYKILSRYNSICKGGYRLS
jgi:hypothetical protein